MSTLKLNKLNKKDLGKKEMTELELAKILGGDDISGDDLSEVEQGVVFYISSGCGTKDCKKICYP